MFRNILMIVLQIFILRKWLEMPAIDQFKESKTLLLSFIFTTINIVMNSYLMWAESNSLREYALDYILLSMKAKIDWIPYGNKLKYCQIGQDIDFSLVELKFPFFTDLIGRHGEFLY